MSASEPPSARRLREARERGWVPRSQVLAPAALVLAVLLVGAARGRALWAALEGWLAAQLALVAQPLGADHAHALVVSVTWPLLGAAAAAWLAVVAVQRVQVGFVWASRAPGGEVAPVLQGWLSGLLVLGVWLAGLALAFHEALALRWLAPALPAGAHGGLRAFAWVLGLSLPLVAAVDVVRTRAAYMRELRMPRHEVERERRETQGPREPRRRQRRLLRSAGRRARRAG